MVNSTIVTHLARTYWAAICFKRQRLRYNSFVKDGCSFVVVDCGSSRMERSLWFMILLTLGIYSVTVRSEGRGVSGAREETWVGSGVSVSVNPRKRVPFSRTAEVEERCPALTPREEDLSQSEHRVRYPFLRKLSFRHGDWKQDERGAIPIMPFQQLDESLRHATTQLASFWATSVGRSGRFPQVSGVIELIIINSQMQLHSSVPPGQFEMVPGFSALSIEVEGNYQTTLDEDVVCMLGCTLLPSLDVGDTQNSTGTIKLEKNCDIMVQIHYPLTFNLTSRVIHGTIQSLAAPVGRFAFSPITLSSQISVGIGTSYKATAQALINTTCSSSEVNVDISNGDVGEFCKLANRYLSDGWLSVVPNWKCNGTVEYCRKIGPFSRYSEHTSFMVDYNSSQVQILVHRFRSRCFAALSGSPEVFLSFMLRLVPAGEAMGLARERSALDGQTLVAEGYSKNGSSSLCMVACKLDDTSGQPDVCNMRISLYVPLSFSVKRHSIFEGTISSLLPKDHPESFFPLNFHMNLEYRTFPSAWSTLLYYNYSKLDEAAAVLSQHEPESSKINAPWLKYPALLGDGSGHYQSLARDLSLHHSLKPSKKNAFTYLSFDVVAIDGYLPFLWDTFSEVDKGISKIDDIIPTETNPRWTHRRPEKRKYLNCSGTMSFTGFKENLSTTLVIFTEGYYSPKDGMMYMVGCRSVTASWQVINDNSFDLDEGMDCAIEVVMEYPTTLASWLLSPSVKVEVHSQRPVDDPFHFIDINAETYPVLYMKQVKNLIFHRNVEGALSVLTLSLMLVCIIGQLLYIGNHLESTPYISLLMVIIQAMGYAIPLVTGAKSLLTRKFDYRKDDFFQEAGWTQMIIYLDKILTLAALLLLVRLFEKVWKERALISDMQQQSVTVPRERNVVVISLIIHAFGFLSVMILHSRNSSSLPATKVKPAGDLIPRLVPANGSEAIWPDMSNVGPVWQKVLQEYAGLVEDLFLLPQAVAFSLWDVKGKPLRLLFFVGLSFLQIVPHVYDKLRDQGFVGYRYTLYANPSFDFYTNVGDILIPALALLLVLLVYIQQRCKGFVKFPARFLYQPLRVSNETELVTANGRNHLPPIPEDDE